MKTLKVIIEVEVPGDTNVTDFAVVVEQVRDVFNRVGYSCKVRGPTLDSTTTPSISRERS